MQYNKLVSAIAGIGFLSFSVNALAADKKSDASNAKPNVTAEQSEKKSANTQASDKESSQVILSPTEMERRGRSKR